MALEQGDIDAFNLHNEAAGRLNDNASPAAQAASLDTATQEIEEAENRIGGAGFQSTTQCQALYQQLSSLYGQRTENNGSEDDAARARGYQNQGQYCQ